MPFGLRVAQAWCLAHHNWSPRVGLRPGGRGGGFETMGVPVPACARGHRAACRQPDLTQSYVVVWDMTILCVDLCPLSADLGGGAELYLVPARNITRRPLLLRMIMDAAFPLLIRM